MNKETKLLLLFSSVVSSFCFSLTTPFIHVHFMQLVSVKLYTISNIISMGLAAFVNTVVTNTKARDFFKKSFTFILIIDSLSFAIISFWGVEHIAIRFLGIAVLNAVSTNLWVIIMKDAINQVVSGDDLTSWQTLDNPLSLWSCLAGLLTSMCINNISLNIGIIIQCATTIFMALIDYKAFKKLNGFNVAK